VQIVSHLILTAVRDQGWALERDDRVIGEFCQSGVQIACAACSLEGVDDLLRILWG
jgi:hypothetical protein